MKKSFVAVASAIQDLIIKYISCYIYWKDYLKMYIFIYKKGVDIDQGIHKVKI